MLRQPLRNRSVNESVVLLDSWTWCGAVDQRKCVLRELNVLSAEHDPFNV